MTCNASWKRRITLLVVLTVAFIWGNSLMPGTVSGAISDWAGAVLSRIFGGEVDTVHGHGVLRKLAHGTEYLILGVELCLLLRPEKPWSTLALSGVLTALLDETIQLFVPERCGPWGLYHRRAAVHIGDPSLEILQKSEVLIAGLRFSGVIPLFPVYPMCAG